MNGCLIGKLSHLFPFFSRGALRFLKCNYILFGFRPLTFLRHRYDRPEFFIFVSAHFSRCVAFFHDPRILIQPCRISGVDGSSQGSNELSIPRRGLWLAASEKCHKTQTSGDRDTAKRCQRTKHVKTGKPMAGGLRACERCQSGLS